VNVDCELSEGFHSRTTHLFADDSLKSEQGLHKEMHTNTLDAACNTANVMTQGRGVDNLKVKPSLRNVTKGDVLMAHIKNLKERKNF
jgi:hypothetical protein